MAYDRNNIFARILRREIPCKKVYEDEYALAFHDIHPQAPVHVLVLPKGEYISFSDFAAEAPRELIVGYVRAIGIVARQLGVEEPGYRLLCNIGTDGSQTVPHLHVHMFGGRRLGHLLVEPRRPP